MSALELYSTPYKKERGIHITYAIDSDYWDEMKLKNHMSYEEFRKAVQGAMEEQIAETGDEMTFLPDSLDHGDHVQLHPYRGVHLWIAYKFKGVLRMCSTIGEMGYEVNPIFSDAPLEWFDYTTYIIQWVDPLAANDPNAEFVVEMNISIKEIIANGLEYVGETDEDYGKQTVSKEFPKGYRFIRYRKDHHKGWIENWYSKDNFYDKGDEKRTREYWEWRQKKRRHEAKVNLQITCGSLIDNDLYELIACFLC